MEEKTQHVLGGLVLVLVVGAIGWHFFTARTATPVSGDFLPYYGPPAGAQATLAQENPEVLQVLPSVPNAVTNRDRWPNRARVYQATAPVLGG